jgi:putative endonuclease
VLARRYKTKLGEIDIVVRRGGILAFVEVKARADFLTATDALGGRQFGRVARAASLYLARHPHYAAHSVRFDAVLVGGPLLSHFWPRHLPDVWRPPE